MVEDCKICGTLKAPVAFRLANDQVIVRRCRNCGFTFVDHHIDENCLETSQHDEAGVPDSDALYMRKFPQRIRLIEEKFGSLSGKRMLDVGAGGGGWLAVAKQRGAQVEGTEFCPVCRSYAARYRGLILDDKSLNDPRWKRRAGFFDFVSAWDVLEHVNDPVNFLKDSINLLASGGKLLISTPVRDTYFDRTGELAHLITGGFAEFLLRQRYSHAHVQIFESGQLLNVVEDLGMKAVYFRKIQELSFEPKRYFRNMYGDAVWTRLLGSAAGSFLHVAPLTNKVMGFFVRNQ